jgi:hypothetical protein
MDFPHTQIRREPTSLSAALFFNRADDYHRVRAHLLDSGSVAIGATRIDGDTYLDGALFLSKEQARRIRDELLQLDLDER